MDDNKMWKPNEEYLNLLISMGISRNVAERALLHTDNCSADIAAAWVFDNPSTPDQPLNEEEIQNFVESGGHLLNDEDEEGSDEEIELPESYDGPYKMVFVVNMELGMGVGKIAAQVAHATLGLHQYLIDNASESLNFWREYDGERKIALKGENKQRLLDMMQQAKSSGLPCYLVSDAGHTQVAAGSNTVLSIFGKEESVNQITGKLKLL